MWDQIQSRINRAVDRIKTSLYGKISSVIKNNKTVYVKMTEDEEIRDVKILSPYGVFSIPTNDVFCQVIFNNSTKKATLVGVENTNIPVEIDVGEIIIYNKQAQSYIYLKKDKSINISGKIVLDDEAIQSLKEALGIGMV